MSGTTTRPPPPASGQARSTIVAINEEASAWALEELASLLATATNATVGGRPIVIRRTGLRDRDDAHREWA
jgi:hypothetical protein